MSKSPSLWKLVSLLMQFFVMGDEKSKLQLGVLSFHSEGTLYE